MVVKYRSLPIACMVMDLTNKGACLEVSSTVYVPRVFDLSFDTKCQSCRSCRLVWRSDEKLGVSFE